MDRNGRHSIQRLHEPRYIMRTAGSEKLSCVSSKDRTMVRDGSKTAVHCMWKALQVKHVLGSAGEMAANLLEFLETITIRTFLRFLIDVAQQPCTYPLYYAQLEHSKSGDASSEIPSRSSNTRTDIVIAS